MIQYIAYPSSLKTIRMVTSVLRYLLGWFWGCGPWILLLATSMGRLLTEAKEPAIKPIKNLLVKEASCNTDNQLLWTYLAIKKSSYTHCILVPHSRIKQ